MYSEEVTEIMYKIFPLLDELSEHIKEWTFWLANWEFKVKFNKKYSEL